MPNQVNEDTGIEMLLRGIGLSTANFDLTSDVQRFLDQHDLLEVPAISTRREQELEGTDVWLMPEQYLQLDVTKYLNDRCDTQEQRTRVRQELELFRARNLENMLRLMIYIVDVMEENGVVWGVGRGSSVASYCLYLIGVHHIDSIRYQLDIKEFLKEDQHATT